MKPHSYQSEAVRSIFAYFMSNHGNPLIAIPTGCGKSIVIAEFLKQTFQSYPHQKIMVLTHVKELIAQNHARCVQMWPQAPAGINSAGLNKRDFHHPIIFAGIGSVAKKPHQFGKVDLIIIDEAHLVSDNDTTTYRKFIDALMQVNPYLKVIGFTATPWRQGVGRLTQNGLFTDICFDITTVGSFHRLIAEGYMAPLIPKRMQNYLDVTGVHMQNGDFNLSQLQLAVDKDEITRAALKEAMEFGHDRKKWIIFAAGVDHSIHVAEILNEMRITCKAVHSKMSDKERNKIIDDYKNGDLQAVSNNNVLTTGFDNPEIDMIVMLRPTTSVVLWVQMIGRGTRPVYYPGYDLSSLDGRLAAIHYGGKMNCLVLDFAGNTQRLGPINDPRLPRKKGEKGGTAPVKACPGCNTYIHISATVCEHCGQEFTFQTKITASSGNQELLSGELPIIEEMKVDRITYSLHHGRGKPDMVKATYYCNLQSFSEYICPQHNEGSYPLKKAREWWRKRNNLLVMPQDAEVFLSHVAKLKPATHIRVWINKKYPEIMSHCFDGSFFNKQEADPFEIPEVVLNQPQTQAVDYENNSVDDDYEDDIPF